MDELKKLLENAGVNRHTGGGQQKWSVEDSSGDRYSIYIVSENAEDEMFVESNGRHIAHAVLGGGGIMSTSIQDPKKLMTALFAFADNNTHRN